MSTWNKILKSIKVVFLYTVIGAVVIAAIFNVRLGFGAQAMDCIDSKVFITRFKTPDRIIRGDYLAFIGAGMGQPFDGHIIIKMVGAVPGDLVTIVDGKMYINSTFVSDLDVAEKAAAKLGVSAESFERELTVPEGSLFMIGTKPHSYDSRYWGLVPIQNVVGTMYPLI